MGMYCCCDERISSDNFECKCDWNGWVSVYDWPPERQNREVPMGLPDRDGKFLIRATTASRDRYEEYREFTLIPRTVKDRYFGSEIIFELHWEGEDLEEGSPYAWKKE